MSKCQKNKYFIGTSCGMQGSAPKTENKGFQQDFAKLMAARDAQDSQIQAKPDTVNEAIVRFKSSKSSKSSKDDKGFGADIDTVLKGDY